MNQDLEKNKNFRESKITNRNIPCLINEKTLNNSKPNEIVLNDFSIIQSKHGPINLHVMINAISHKVIE